MELICDCGEMVEFVDGENGSSFTEGEGFYKEAKGDIEIYGEHDQVFFRCQHCGEEIWIFT